MDIKNFLSGVSPRAKLIAIAGFICAVAVLAGLSISKINDGNIVNAALLESDYSVCAPSYDRTLSTAESSCAGYAAGARVCAEGTDRYTTYCKDGRYWSGLSATTKDCKCKSEPQRYVHLSGGKYTNLNADGSVKQSTIGDHYELDNQESVSAGSVLIFQTLSLKSLNCTGSCGGSLELDKCAYNKTFGKYCVCGSDGKYKIVDSAEEYCKVCSRDTAACSCSYTSADGVKKVFNVGAENSICGKDRFLNYSLSCVDPSKGYNAKRCINGSCSSGKCSVESSTCSRMDDKIITVAGYIKKKWVVDGQNKLDEDHASYETVKADLKTLSGTYGVNAASMQDYASKETVGDHYAVACVNDLERECSENSRKSYKCATVSKNGCRVWAWVTGSGTLCSKIGGYYCDYLKNSVTGQYLTDSGNKLPTGYCSNVTTGGAAPDNNADSKIGEVCSSNTYCSTDGALVCAFKDKASSSGLCVVKEDACMGSSSRFYQADVDVHFCTGSSYYQCKFVEEYGAAKWYEDDYCENGCDASTGKCAGEKETPASANCSSSPKPCLVANNDCSSCGSGWKCVARQSVVNVLGFTSSQINSLTSGDGVCVPEEEIKQITGTCNFSVTAGQPSTSNKNCSGGIYVPFIVDGEGNCSGLSCTVANSYNNQKSTAYKGSSNNWYSCVKVEQKQNSDQSQEDSTSKTNTSQIDFQIICTDSASKKSSGAESSCPFPQGSDNSFNQDKKDKEDQEKKNNTAPKVSVTGPTGTVEEKTAELKATTDIKSTCTYTDNAGGNSVSGMTMTSGDGGYNHTATLGSLGNNLSNCRASHSITVTCKNSEATSAAAAVGTGQTTFTVDLSKNQEYMPKVSSGMDDDKFTVANPVLKAVTDRPADCEYKKGNDFTFGSGTKFDSTGSYNHNAQLSGLDSNKGEPYKYYVVCKDKDACAPSAAGFKIEFKVALEDDPDNAPNIESTTPETQNAANPTLSVTTNIPSTCQYKKDGAFKYGDSGAIQFINDSDYSHTVSLATLPDDTYNFYVACKGKTAGAAKTYDRVITTTLSRSGAVGPIVSNTTNPNQTMGTPTLSIATLAAATCQYKEGSDFAYGSGTQFTTDGGTGHSAALAALGDGQHTYWIVCKDSATGVANAAGTQIMFTVNSASETCADLSSNDKQNDNERNFSGTEDDAGSGYLWRSMEAGTRDLFTKVDWYAGYQFTAKKDGQINQLCGYFGDGDTNKVILYGGSFNELASVMIKGEDDWKCASISPVPVKEDNHFYVVARIQDNPIYYEYESGLLSADGEDAVVEWGVRQLADEKFGRNIKKYDYMVFGLVDVRIKTAQTNTNGPAVDSPLPVGSVNDADTKISVHTNIDATCKFDREDVDYSDMEYTFGKTSGKNHEQMVCGLDDGPFTFYARCKGQTGTNNASTPIQFEISD